MSMRNPLPVDRHGLAGVKVRYACGRMLFHGAVVGHLSPARRRERLQRLLALWEGAAGKVCPECALTGKHRDDYDDTTKCEWNPAGEV